MKGPNRRKDESALRSEWTARLNAFAAATTAKQRQAAIEPALKINPGGAIRGLLEAWGYSASSRGRKAKSARAEPQRKQGREQLEAVLDTLYGKSPSPVPNLNKKLAGTHAASVADACRILGALLHSWPDAIHGLDPARSAKDSKPAKGLAETFIRELLSDLSDGRSHLWAPSEMDVRVFNLIDEERIGISQFIRDAGHTDGALIVAGARDILLGVDPIDAVRQFYLLTEKFIGEDHRGILIFAFDLALFEAGDEAYRLLYNLQLLSAAFTAFALFDQRLDKAFPIIQHKVDWNRWRTLSTRCCAVMRKPTLIDPASGEFLTGQRFDDFVKSACLQPDFERLDGLRGFIRFDGSHVLPRTYPKELSSQEDLSGRDLYWDVTIKRAGVGLSDLEVQYFTPPVHRVGSPNEPHQPVDRGVSFSPTLPRRAGRPPAKTMTIEEEPLYVVKRDSPGTYYDDAQRAMYLAARARLHLDTGAHHAENLNAASALRQVGYEVIPLSILPSLVPLTLQHAAQHALKATAAENITGDAAN